MTATPATSAYEIVLAVHVMAVVIAFGWTFTLPVVFAVFTITQSHDLLHRLSGSRLIITG